MMKQIFIVFSLMILLVLPKYALGDCVDLRNYTDWILEDEHTIVFYTGEAPIARVNIPYCEILPSSSIRLVKSYVCDLDSIVVDDKKCSIIEVKVMY
jgi:hypothetical protein